MIGLQTQSISTQKINTEKNKAPFSGASVRKFLCETKDFNQKSLVTNLLVYALSQASL